MRSVVLSMMTTLNGRLDDPDAWLANIGDDLYADIDRAYEAFDTVLVGRVTYEEMLAYWPGAETEEGGSDVSKRMARKMNSYKKFVISSESDKSALEWANAELVIIRGDQDMVTFINELKAQTGGDIHLSGGAHLAQSIARLGLVDEYRFFVYPVVSAGQAWFGQIEGNRDMHLISTTAYTDGVIALTYKPRNEA